MKNTVWVIMILFILTIISNNSTAQEIPLQDLSSFKSSKNGWHIKGNILINPLEASSFETEDGTGILVGSAPFSGKDSRLEMNEDHGDAIVEFEFLLSHEASVVLWLQGRYGLRLTDSWRKEEVGIYDNGAIIPPQDEKGVASLGLAANMNTARAPGAWQHIKVVFEAPDFDSDNIKNNNARLISVMQNGVVIQENQYLPTSGKDSPYSSEVTQGPLVLQISNGYVAFRNIRLMRKQERDEGIPKIGSVEPIILTPSNGPLFQRSFLFYGDQKLLTCMNVGSPRRIHYSYNMASGGLIQVWRGDFGDVTSMWHGRGVQQVLRPLGSVLHLDPDQQVILQSSNTAESTNTEPYYRQGYSIGDNGYPIFEYTVGAVKVYDQISPGRDSPVLERYLQFSSKSVQPQIVQYRIASASSIEEVSKNLYSIGDQAYYVLVDEEAKIMEQGDIKELIVSIDMGSGSRKLKYSIIW